MFQAPTHPLLNLPDDEIIQKLREMNLEEILKFSLISERCKELVKSIQTKGDSMRVSIGSDIVVSIKIGSKNIQLTYYRERNMYWSWGAYGRKRKLTEPQSVLVEVTNFTDHSEDTTFELGRRNFTMKDWLEQLQDIFSYRKIDCIWFFHSSFEFDIDDIKEVFENTSEMKIGDTGCHVFNQMILRKFLTCEKLSIRASSFPNSKVPEGILIQHFDKLQIGHFLETTIMPLDQLLLVNTKKMSTVGFQRSAKQLNTFIKLWQSGSNPCMEYLSIIYTTENEGDKEVIMKGIKHEIIPIDEIRKFKATGNRMQGEIEGGIDIVRKDGTKATIRLRNSPLFATLEMFVWFDHCVVEP